MDASYVLGNIFLRTIPVFSEARYFFLCNFPPSRCFCPQTSCLLYLTENFTIALLYAIFYYRLGHSAHDDVIIWKHFPLYWPFVRGIHLLPLNSPHASDTVLDVFFYLRVYKHLSEQSWGWWLETPSRSLWRHCNMGITGFVGGWAPLFSGLFSSVSTAVVQ